MPPMIAGVVVVNLVGQLASGDVDLLGVDDDEVIAHVHVRAVISLVLALQAMGNGRSQATKGLSLGINEVPIAADGAGFGENRLGAQSHAHLG